jgi:hypothetical protein
MGNEGWLIRRNVDASRKIFVAMGIIVFDFELFIGELVKKEELTVLSSCELFDNVWRCVYC